MTKVGKYNTFKGISLAFTSLPTLYVTYLQKELFVIDAGTSISFAALIGILLAFLFLKDKIAENFKIPSAFVIATVLFVTIVLIERILLPVKTICLVVMVVCGIDELVFKRIYKCMEMTFPECSKIYKHFGFYIGDGEKILGVTNEQN